MWSINFSNFKCETPEVRGENYNVLKEMIILHLRWMDIDYTIRNDKPNLVTETSLVDDVDCYEMWERSNHLDVMFIKTNISASIHGYIDYHNNVWALWNPIDEQFETFDKALASTLIINFSTTKFITLKGVHEHIIKMRDIATQLKTLEVDISDFFSLCTKFELSSTPIWTLQDFIQHT